MKTHIMIHHSLTKDGAEVSWGAIERYHLETQGWRDIGYHAGIELVGSAILGPMAYQAMMGRPEREIAAACPQGNMNALALHVCVVGNYDLAPPSLNILTRLVQRILLPWMADYGIPPERIIGHRDFNPAKTCPGRMFDLDLVRKMVR